jgi:hypothetical protein
MKELVKSKLKNSILCNEIYKRHFTHEFYLLGKSGASV